MSEYDFSHCHDVDFLTQWNYTADTTACMTNSQNIIPQNNIYINYSIDTNENSFDFTMEVFVYYSSVKSHKLIVASMSDKRIIYYTA